MHREITNAAEAAAYMQQVALKLRNWRESMDKTRRRAGPEEMSPNFSARPGPCRSRTVSPAIRPAAEPPLLSNCFRSYVTL